MTIGIWISRVHYCRVWRGVPTFKSMPYVQTLTRKYSTWTLHILSLHYMYQKTRDITWIFFYFTALMDSSETNHIN